ncbi:MAG: hypothetical protein AB4426_05690 [Xenococcaceae cyanobacterium]
MSNKLIQLLDFLVKSKVLKLISGMVSHPNLLRSPLEQNLLQALI